MYVKAKAQHPQKKHNGAPGVRLVVAALILRGGPGTNEATNAEASTEVPGNQVPGTKLTDSQTLEVLICQRKPDQAMALKWEFPGGKIEPGEGPEQALQRELNEELGIDAVIGPRIAHIRHNYRNGGAVDLQFFTVREFAGQLENRIFHDMHWSSLAKLPSYDFLAADRDLIKDLAEGKLL